MCIARTRRRAPVFFPVVDLTTAVLPQPAITGIPHLAATGIPHLAARKVGRPMAPGGRRRKAPIWEFPMLCGARAA